MAVPPQSASGEKQIEVRQVLKRVIQPGERESSFEQRNIERSTVVRDHKLETLEQLRQREQHRWFFIEVADEELKDLKLISGKKADADEEWTHAGTALYSRRFRIQKNNAIAFR